MIVPQKAAPLMPTTAKARPPNPPCTIPITSVPFTVARVTETNLSTIRSSSSAESGM